MGQHRANEVLLNLNASLSIFIIPEGQFTFVLYNKLPFWDKYTTTYPAHNNKETILGVSGLYIKKVGVL